MSASAQEWLEIAEEDLDTVRRSLQPDPLPNRKSAAYHVQQAAEKTIKAYLVFLSIAYPRGSGGHNIGNCAQRIPTSNALFHDAMTLEWLTPWATIYRYPSDDPATSTPLPEVSEIEQWRDKVVAFKSAVDAEINPPLPPGP